MAKLIAVSSSSGGGKSTLIANLTSHRPRTVGFNLYDYTLFDDSVTPKVWNEFEKWLTPKLQSDLQILRTGQSFTPAVMKSPISDYDLVLVEDPFGRCRSAYAELYDFVFYIDIPLEVALVRRLQRRRKLFIPASADHLDREQLIDGWKSFWKSEVDPYIAVNRSVYIDFRERVGSDADLVLDGMRSEEELVSDVMQFLSDRI